MATSKSTKLYDKKLRGQLVTVSSGNIAFAYPAPELTNDWSRLTGPTTVGQATGYYFQLPDQIKGTGTVDMIEVVYVTGITALAPVPALRYVQRSAILLDSNPTYDASLDTNKPADDGTPAPAVAASEKEEVVSDKPGTGIPYKDKDGNLVYVDIEQLRSMVSSESADTSSDSTKKLLTYGLYGIIGLSAIALIVILINSFRKPKAPVQQ
nr:hypothetical protein [uncultured Arsenicibacter sp.]